LDNLILAGVSTTFTFDDYFLILAGESTSPTFDAESSNLTIPALTSSSFFASPPLSPSIILGFYPGVTVSFVKAIYSLEILST
jgi:hypothetical protein